MQIRPAETTVGLSYDREADTIYVRLRDVPSVEKREDIGDGRLVDYAGGEPVGVEFRHVQRGIRTDALPDILAAVAAIAAAFAALVRSLQDRDAETPPSKGSVDFDGDVAAYLFRSPANRERLLAAYQQALAGEGEIINLEQLRRELGLAKR